MRRTHKAVHFENINAMTFLWISSLEATLLYKKTEILKWNVKLIWWLLGLFWTIFTRPNPRSSNKRKRSETYLMVELPVADWELWPEKESKLFVHHRLRPLLLRALDLLQRHVTKAHGKLTSGLNKVIKEIAQLGVKGWSPGGIPLSACCWQCLQSWWGEMFSSLPKYCYFGRTIPTFRC